MSERVTILGSLAFFARSKGLGSRVRRIGRTPESLGSFPSFNLKPKLLESRTQILQDVLNAGPLSRLIDRTSRVLHDPLLDSIMSCS